jgi:protein SCO1/2
MRNFATRLCALVLLLGATCADVCARAQDHERAEGLAPAGLERVGLDEHLGREIPRDLVFRDHTGRRVRIGDLLDGRRPVVLNLVYHSCPSSCSLVLDGTVRALSRNPWTVGQEVIAITVSIDPRDTPEVAARKRARILRRYGRAPAARGWHFLVPERSMSEHELIGAYGIDPAAARLARAIGYRYEWIPRQREYAHPGVIMLLTPSGRVARYLYGLEYEPNDVRLGLLEASEGHSISSGERFLLYCYRYDSREQKYVVMAWRVMRIGGGACALLLFAFLFYMWRRELARKRRQDAPEARPFLSQVRAKP